STLSGRKRALNVKGAYKIEKGADVKGKRIILIDDVFTTGATTMEVSKVLKRAGAKYVLVATVAKSIQVF
ncbi:MAG TPA: phosphoribosyltransferase family protein, partial [Candidatus Woesebacteria bacterium]|nr:phosphoribosyltransferase family protein [Candidatus Woesebacteria bacterium]